MLSPPQKHLVSTLAFCVCGIYPIFFYAVPGSSLRFWDLEFFGQSETESAFNHLLVVSWRF